MYFLYGHHFSSLRIPDGSSVFTAEAKAIGLALDFNDSCFLYHKFQIVVSDSLLASKALNHTSFNDSQPPPRPPPPPKKNQDFCKIIADTKEILVCWLPHDMLT